LADGVNSPICGRTDHLITLLSNIFHKESLNIAFRYMLSPPTIEKLGGDSVNAVAIFAVLPAGKTTPSA
jgi:hypothetical protein